MSADNTIVVLQTIGQDRRPEYRVAHVQAAENIMYHYNRTFRDWYVKSEFGTCRVYRNLAAALRRADWLLAAQHYVEYGIDKINTRRKFPGTPRRVKG